jgi:integrase/recombinase XerD
MAERWEGLQVLDADGRRKYLSAEERARFLAAADRLSPGKRAFCYVLVFTGCRISEALALTTDSVDAERRKVVIRTLKRRRLIFRAVPVPNQTIDLLRRLPAGANRRLWQFRRVTGWRLIKTTMMCAGISGPMASPKGLRRGFGIRAADRKV